MVIPIPESGHGVFFLFAEERHFASSFSELNHFNYFRPSPRKPIDIGGDIGEHEPCKTALSKLSV